MYYNINYETLKEEYELMKLKRKIKNRVFVTYDLEGNRHEVTPKRVEKILLINDYVLNAIVVKKKDDIKKYVPVVFVVLKDGTNITTFLIDIMKLCRTKLKDYEIPVDIRLIDSLPLNDKQEIDYKKLEEQCNQYCNVGKHLIK